MKSQGLSFFFVFTNLLDYIKACISIRSTLLSQAGDKATLRDCALNIALFQFLNGSFSESYISFTELFKLSALNGDDATKNIALCYQHIISHLTGKAGDTLNHDLHPQNCSRSSFDSSKLFQRVENTILTDSLTQHSMKLFYILVKSLDLLNVVKFENEKSLLRLVRLLEISDFSANLPAIASSRGAHFDGVLQFILLAVFLQISENMVHFILATVKSNHDVSEYLVHYALLLKESNRLFQFLRVQAFRFPHSVFECCEQWLKLLNSIPLSSGQANELQLRNKFEACRSACIQLLEHTIFSNSAHVPIIFKVFLILWLLKAIAIKRQVRFVHGIDIQDSHQSGNKYIAPSFASDDDLAHYLTPKLIQAIHKSGLSMSCSFVSVVNNFESKKNFTLRLKELDELLCRSSKSVAEILSFDQSSDYEQDGATGQSDETFFIETLKSMM
jgi:hypothetical protein